MPITKEFLEIWKETEPRIPELPFRLQLETYVAQFPTQAAAEKYADGIRRYRAQMQFVEQQRRQ